MLMIHGRQQEMRKLVNICIINTYSHNSASQLQVASEPSEVKTDDSTQLSSGIGCKLTIAKQS